MANASLDELGERLGIVLRDPKAIAQAFVHSSYFNENPEAVEGHNERLEFLGDAILGAVVCDLLYHQYPEYLEGDLTRLKSIVVSRQTCAKISDSLGMEELLILGKGMTTHPTVPPSLLADVFESLIAAIYLDGGMKPAREFIEKHMGPEIELAAVCDLVRQVFALHGRASEVLWTRIADRGYEIEAEPQ